MLCAFVMFTYILIWHQVSYLESLDALTQPHRLKVFFGDSGWYGICVFPSKTAKCVSVCRECVGVDMSESPPGSDWVSIIGKQSWNFS